LTIWLQSDPIILLVTSQYNLNILFNFWQLCLNFSMSLVIIILGRIIIVPSFGEKLRIVRQKNGLTLDELAEKLQTTKTTLSRYENNKRTPNIDFAKTLAEYFGISPNYFLFDDETFDSSLSSTTTIKGPDLPPELQGIVDEIVVDTKALIEEGLTEEDIAYTLNVAKHMIEMRKATRIAKKEEFMKSMRKKKDD
jgi:transcriptional regulator with XRE-family HTH domain